VARICSRDQRVVLLRERFVAVIAPVGLNEHTVDLFEIDDAHLIAHGLNEGGQTEIAGAPQQARSGTDDEGQSVGREGVVADRLACTSPRPCASLPDPGGGG
jgi:hypothetical protein